MDEQRKRYTDKAGIHILMAETKRIANRLEIGLFRIGTAELDPLFRIEFDGLPDTPGKVIRLSDYSQILGYLISQMTGDVINGLDARMSARVVEEIYHPLQVL